jgi:hypothetical protein
VFEEEATTSQWPERCPRQRDRPVMPLPFSVKSDLVGELSLYHGLLRSGLSFQILSGDLRCRIAMRAPDAARIYGCARPIFVLLDVPSTLR